MNGIVNGDEARQSLEEFLHFICELFTVNGPVLVSALNSNTSIVMYPGEANPLVGLLG